MIHQDYEREALQERAFLLEQELETEKDYYLWLEKQYYDDSEDKATLREGIGHEFVFDTDAGTQSSGNEPATIQSESQKLAEDSGKKELFDRH